MADVEGSHKMTDIAAKWGTISDEDWERYSRLASLDK
jgi:hypothetical protein